MLTTTNPRAMLSVEFRHRDLGRPDKRADGRTDGRMDRRTNGWTDGRTDVRLSDGWTG